jgi:hypothetical protein
MKSDTILIASATLVIACFVTFMTVAPFTSGSTDKSDRLDGQTTETAFLPERFGVPSTQ